MTRRLSHSAARFQFPCGTGNFWSMALSICDQGWQLAALLPAAIPLA
jgi:hypothetical protein